MSDVSNRTIVALLAVALVVSVAGTMYSVSELGALGGSYTLLTGAVSGNGTSQLEIDITAGLSVTDAGIDFGSGHTAKNATDSTSELYTDSTNWDDWTSTSGGDVVSGSSANNGFLLENTGSSALEIEVEATQTAEEWLCGGSSVCTDSTSANVKIEFYQESMDIVGATGDDSAASCRDNMNSVGWEDIMTDNSFIGAATNSAISICDYLYSDLHRNEIAVDLHVTVPSEATTSNTAASTTFVFSASAAN